MKLLILVLCGFVAHATATGCDCKFEGGPDGNFMETIANARLDGMTLRIDQVEEDLNDVSKTIEKRFAAARRYIAQTRSFSARLDEIEGTGCGKREFQCGQGTHKCISHLAMCDGHKDCPNGADESDATCELPFSDGTAFEGTFYGKNRFGCDNTVSEKLRFVVVKITREPYLKSYVKIHFYTVITYHKDGEILSANYIDDGYYNIATRKLVVLPDEGEEFQVALACEFDPADSNSCHGKMVHINSLKPCAELHLFKLDK